MEIKEKIKSYYAGMGIKVDNEYIESLLNDKERAKEIIRIYKKEEVEAMNYILGRDTTKTGVTKIELEAMNTINLFNKKVVEVCKNIWTKEMLGGAN